MKIVTKRFSQLCYVFNLSDKYFQKLFLTKLKSKILHSYIITYMIAYQSHRLVKSPPKSEKKLKKWFRFLLFLQTILNLRTGDNNSQAVRSFK